MNLPTAQRSGRYWGYAVIGAVLLVYAVVLVRTAWLCDDAYISLRTVGNFVSGYGLRWNIDERVQAYTHPLWMFLMSGLFCLTANIYYSAIFGSILLSLAAVLIYAFGIARTVWHAILGLAILLFSKAFVDYSTSGLENPLSYLLVGLFLMVYLGTRRQGTGGRGQVTGEQQQQMTRGRLLQLALLAGLIVLNRMDLLLLIGPALAYAFWQATACHSERNMPCHSERSEESRRSPLRQPGRARQTAKALGLVLLGFAPFIAWEIFSIIYYGFPFPNTAYAKLNTGIPAAELFRHGLYYLANSLRSDPVTLPAIACGVVAAGLSRQGRRIALASGILLYLLYTVRIGGDFMSGRYFAVPLLASVAVLGTLDLSGWAAKAGWSTGMLAAIALGLLSPNPSLLTGGAYGLVGDGLVDAHGIADERAWYYIFTGLLRTNPKWGHRILREAQKVRDSHQTVIVSADTIGLFGYHVGPDVHIVDVFALADPFLARLPMKPNPNWRIGHFERDVPAGYVESLRTGKNDLVDPHLRDLYGQIALITRGPLFSRQRWAAIWRLNVGG